MNQFLLTVTLAIIICFTCHSQNERIKGPLIEDFGKTYRVEKTDIATDTTKTLKLILDVSKTNADKTAVNPYIETAARFLNMHVEAGFKPEQLKVALTIHADAWQDILSDDAYAERFETKNPNTELINQLTEAGVDVILCGQTAGHRNISEHDTNENVKLALSAMTALIQYQNNGYRFIKF